MYQNEIKNTLYGDGIHDDYPAIQEMLDQRLCEVNLPAPKVCYCISKTLKIHGGQTLRLPTTAVIKLLPDSNCSMLEDDDFQTWKSNICIEGGIWDFNNIEQDPNPYHFANKQGVTYADRLAKFGITDTKNYFKTLTFFLDFYSGFCMRFCRVKHFSVKNVTYRNPVCYAIQIGYVEDFVFDTIYFDYTQCNPKFWNMDGIHVEGGCHNGVIRNLYGTCHDDLVALTADDGLYGAISNVVVDGIFAEHCHSAVRLLSHELPVSNISIKNIFGSYYTYCIGLTKYGGDKNINGVMKNIFIENVCACASQGTKDVEGGNYPFIWIEAGLDVENFVLDKVVREEYTYTTSTVKIDNGANVDGLVISNVLQKNHTNGDLKCLDIQGCVKHDVICNIREE